ncbi:protein phosphatase 1 regulatory subunit 15A [Anastrepha ludens]|uniref:protein phosphatase 1 regulatory subunit 15A n=1 Tax=Anastrepha ludens TaxID=28586 RepID=UPI0023B16211|nr:protein phosphatase 1 regulatory subunit 15A [Anastrepha ludens]
MSSKSVSYTCDRTENTGSSSQSNILNVKSSFKEPGSKNILQHLLTTFSMPFCDEVNKTAAAALSAEGEETSDDDSANDTKAHPISLGCPYWAQRRRTISEQSDDICFLDDDGSTYQTSDSSPAYYDDDEDDDDDDEDSSDTEDDDCTSENNFDLEKYHSNESLDEKISTSIEPTTHGKIKKVRFNLAPEIHTMYAWSFAYQSARKGHWEMFARDRDRFRKRIENTSKYLNPILTPEHRNMIYNTRFSNEI